MRKIKVVLILMLLSYSNGLIAQDYILFFKKEGSSKDYYNLTVLLNFKNQVEDMELAENSFQFKLLEFPRNELDIMVCCEMDTLTWFTIDEFSQIVNKYNSSTVDSLSKMYEKGYSHSIRYSKKYGNPPFIGKWNSYSVFGYQCVIEICNCYLRNFYNQRWQGYDVGYVKNITKLKKMNKIQKSSLVKYFDKIFSQKQIVEKLSSQNP